jgi:peptidyl-prolyl cis-trans isomerase B (cyclophilin B)
MKKWLFLLVLLNTTISVFAQSNLTKPDPEIVALYTNYGKISIELYPGAAPKHVANFKKLVQSGFYNGTKFHRVIPGFMIQGGDPNSKDNDRSNDGTGDAGYTIKAEFNDISHKRGIVSMARSADPDSASCQFFIMVADGPSLDHKYSAFGNVISGMAVADKIVGLPRDPRDNPNTPAIIKKAAIEKHP